MRRIVYLLLMMVLMGSSCRNDVEQKLRVMNNSDQRIYYDWSSRYPDTSLLYSANPKFDPYICRVEAHTLSNFSLYSLGKSYFDQNIDTMVIFIFSAEVIETIPWDTVKAKDMVLKMYFLSMEDLEALNWQVNYP